MWLTGFTTGLTFPSEEFTRAEKLGTHLTFMAHVRPAAVRPVGESDWRPPHGTDTRYLSTHAAHDLVIVMGCEVYEGQTRRTDDQGQSTAVRTSVRAEYCTIHCRRAVSSG